MSDPRLLIPCEWAQCEYEFTDLTHLVQHLHDHHIGLKKPGEYTCEWNQCPRQGIPQASRFSLIAHMRSHTGERPYDCSVPECDKSFTRSDALAKHQKQQHGITTPSSSSTTTTTTNTTSPDVNEIQLDSNKSNSSINWTTKSNPEHSQVDVKDEDLSPPSFSSFTASSMLNLNSVNEKTPSSERTLKKKKGFNDSFFINKVVLNSTSSDLHKKKRKKEEVEEEEKEEQEKTGDEKEMKEEEPKEDPSSSFIKEKLLSPLSFPFKDPFTDVLQTIQSKLSSSTLPKLNVTDTPLNPDTTTTTTTTVPFSSSSSTSIPMHLEKNNLGSTSSSMLMDLPSLVEAWELKYQFIQEEFERHQLLYHSSLQEFQGLMVSRNLILDAILKHSKGVPSSFISSSLASLTHEIELDTKKLNEEEINENEKEKEKEKQENQKEKEKDKSKTKVSVQLKRSSSSTTSLSTSSLSTLKSDSISSEGPKKKKTKREKK